MSYILDALKKANAEREHERGVGPGLHTQPIRSVSDSPAPISVTLKKRQTLVLTLLGALLLCGVSLTALFWSRAEIPAQSPTPPQSLSPLSAPQTAPTAPLIVADSNQTSQTSQANQTIPTVLVQTPTVGKAPIRVTPTPYGLVEPPTNVPPSSPIKPSPPIAAPKPRPAPVPPAPPIESPMPAKIRDALPPLVISGSTYSENPAYRMLIINGQVYREGESPVPEVKLQQIRAKSVLLQYREHVYVLQY